MKEKSYVPSVHEEHFDLTMRTDVHFVKISPHSLTSLSLQTTVLFVSIRTELFLCIIFSVVNNMFDNKL